MDASVPHSLNIEQCRRISATAIDSVDAFSDKQIVLSYSGGRIIVAGSGMKIVNFSKTSGSFAATGDIISVRYAAKGMGLRQKLFK
ncbi:MAG: YabP/YqfC family sporulation protein [Clostridia bacterium]|nr:YabP/YqfC family sporulation protein [Clostridia bacterium]